jgi:hypothetical protein
MQLPLINLAKFSLRKKCDGKNLMNWFDNYACELWFLTLHLTILQPFPSGFSSWSYFNSSQAYKKRGCLKISHNQIYLNS